MERQSGFAGHSQYYLNFDYRTNVLIGNLQDVFIVLHTNLIKLNITLSLLVKPANHEHFGKRTVLNVGYIS